MSQKVLSYDLGGTKIAAGIVNIRGRILEETRVPASFQDGKEAVLRQLTDIGRELLKRHPSISRVGIASAGPLDRNKGVLLDPTNFSSEKGSWGKVPIARILKKSLKRPVYLENDAAAAILAERWIGAAKKYKNAMILTLGTGLGTGIICNGEIVRAGRSLHPEAGHIVIRQGDLTAPCGCGNFGCAEAFLSGRNFGRRTQLKLSRPDLTSKEIADLARSGNPVAQAAFDEYSELMATAIHNYAKIYCPEILIFTGSFAETADLFVNKTKRHLQNFLKRSPELVPKLKVSSLHNTAGIVGGAYVAFRNNCVSASV